MKLNRRQLRKLINEAVNEGFGIDTAVKKREVGGSTFKAAQEDAKENGKAYFINKRNEVIVFDEDGNAQPEPNMTNKDAYEANDGTVHYHGQL